MIKRFPSREELESQNRETRQLRWVVKGSLALAWIMATLLMIVLKIQPVMVGVLTLSLGIAFLFIGLFITFKLLRQKA